MKLSRKRIVVAGLFSSKVDDPTRILAVLAERLTQAGGEIVEIVLQRRGVSRGGVARLTAPLSPTLFGTGKTTELATLCRQHDVDLVVVHTTLTESQRRRLSEACGALVQDAESLGLL